MTDSNLKLFTPIPFRVSGLNRGRERRERGAGRGASSCYIVATTFQYRRGITFRGNVCPVGGNTSRARVIGDRFKEGITASGHGRTSERASERARPDTVSAKPSHNARNLSRGTARNDVLLLFPGVWYRNLCIEFEIERYRRTAAAAAAMKSSRHFDRSLEPDGSNKPRRNVLSRVVGTCAGGESPVPCTLRVPSNF